MSHDRSHPLAAQQPVAVTSPAHGVDVWLCGLERSAVEIEALATTLSAAETVRAKRFGTTALRDRYVVGRATLRTLLAARLGMPAADIAIERGRRGRPFTPDAPTLDFNVSHTRGVAFVGMTEDGRIGVDIEHDERIVNVPGVARKFMSDAEQALLAGLDPDGQRRALLRLWTCKEAMSKATGDALSAPFRHISVKAAKDSIVVEDGPPPYVPDEWRLAAVPMPGGFLATVALWHGELS